ncbi:hypothetical protein [Phenylobacterium sp.]|uniref:hypothetical protein n=1 Tax=Phenylobacterium sp. TaxID=1871053 RepID=UPI002DED1419|nr:hypothetical protein [Phenylobacterium sp.]
MAKKAATDRAKKAALDKALRGMFGRLQGRPVSDRLMSIVDQLEAADRPPLKKTKSA